MRLVKRIRSFRVLIDVRAKSTWFSQSLSLILQQDDGACRPNPCARCETRSTTLADRKGRLACASRPKWAREVPHRPTPPSRATARGEHSWMSISPSRGHGLGALGAKRPWPHNGEIDILEVLPRAVARECGVGRCGTIRAHLGRLAQADRHLQSASVVERVSHLAHGLGRARHRPVSRWRAAEPGGSHANRQSRRGTSESLSPASLSAPESRDRWDAGWRSLQDDLSGAVRDRLRPCLSAFGHIGPKA